MEAIFITARLKSTRLPRKVLLEVNNKTIVGYQIERLQAQLDQKIILCTSVNPEDDPLIDEAKKYGIDYFRGSEEDVLKRYEDTCKAFNINAFYIVYGDEPFLDIEAVKTNFEWLDPKNCMWILNSDLIDGTFGYGMTFKAIAYANMHKTSTNNEVWGEMLMKTGLQPVIYDNQHVDKNLVRLTIDYEEDFEVFKELISVLGDRFKTASIREIVDVYLGNKLYDINLQRIKDYYNRINIQKNI